MTYFGIHRSRPNLLGILVLGLALTAPGAKTPVADPRSAYRDSLAERLFWAGSHQARFSLKGRWSSRTIEATLKRLSKTKPLEVLNLGENACTGADLTSRHYPGGLWSVGGGHPLYGRSWTFDQGFDTVFGVREGMDTSEVRIAFGKPHAKAKGVFLYLSEPLPEGEEHGAPSRWKIGIFFRNGKVESLMLYPEFDDC